jgi:ELWxxDGT repeat protein
MACATAPAASRSVRQSRRCAPPGAPGRSLVVLALLTLAGLAGLARDATAAPHLVADLNTGPAGDYLSEMLLGVEHDGIAYFPATDPQHGQELWRTDGTAEGTYRLTDLCPGTCDSGASPLAFLSGYLLFVAGDGDRQSELWRTDGVPGHETLVKELCPGLCQVAVVDSIVWKGELWLLVLQEAHAPMLWRTDGTPRGTLRVADFCADLGICGFQPYGEAFLGTAAAGDALLLTTLTDSFSLVRTDGTREGTLRLHRFAQYPTIASPRFQQTTLTGTALAGQAAAPGPLFFVDGTQLWVTDGTLAGTHFVRDVADLVAAPDFLLSQSWEVVDGALYIVDDNGDWLRSDGTAAGTVVLAQLPSDWAPAICHLGSVVYAVTTVGIWRTGGTPETTALVVPLALDFGVEELVEQPGRLFIQSFPDLFISDGTAPGTRRIRLPGAPTPDEYTLAPLLDGATFASGGNLLWRIDATAQNVTLLRDFEPADGSSGPYGQAVFGGELFFIAQTGPAGQQLVATDGTLAGTRLVAAAALDAYVGEASISGTAGAHLFLNAGGRYWATDGTDRGTRSLGGRDLAYGIPIAAIGDRLVFAGWPRNYGDCDFVDTEPWISDGTPAHTRQILDLNPFYGPGGGSQCDDLPLPSDPGPGVSLGDSVLFAADDLIHGRELFVTDGTAAGTRLVADINPATMPNDVTEYQEPALIGVGSNPTDFVRYGSGAFFVADDGTTGRQLWFSNGKPRGTYRVVDRGAAPYDSAPHDLVIFQGALYFIAAHDGGEALFRSDATSNGTVLVDDLVLGGEPSFAQGLTVAGGSLFFVAFNETTGSELWVSRGTPGSTHLVVDLRPGLLGSAPQNLAAVGGVLVFAADDGLFGLEPWRSDGTAAGTFRLADIAAGSAASSPGPFSVLGDLVLFGADDGIHGRELWALPVADVRGERP